MNDSWSLIRNSAPLVRKGFGRLDHQALNIITGSNGGPPL
jgi:hypothetical protein